MGGGQLRLLATVLCGWFFVWTAIAAEPRSPQTKLNARSSFGPFPAETKAEKELEVLLAGPDDKIDLALANWLIVADLPPFKNVTREQYFIMLDGATDRVRSMVEQARRNPLLAGDMNDPSRLAFIYCSAMIALGIDYKEEFKIASEGPEPGAGLPIYRDANNVFLIGLLQTRRGSCVSMPMLYLVVGRRLGLPLHLVVIGEHYFIRWEDSSWRMNIETTIVKKVCMSPDERNWLEIEHLTRDQVKGTTDLQNLTPRQVVAQLLVTRAGWYLAKGRQYYGREFWRDLSRAHYLSPKDRMITMNYRMIERLNKQAQANQGKFENIPAPTRAMQERNPSWPAIPRPIAPTAPNPAALVPQPRSFGASSPFGQ